MSKQFYFKPFGFTKVHSLVLFDPKIGLYQELPVAMKECSAFPKNSRITGTSPSNCLESYTGHSSKVSYPFAEKHLVYSIVPANCAIKTLIFQE